MSGIKKYFCDSSFLFALSHPEDDFFDSATSLFKEAQKEKACLLTTWDVLSETITLFRYKVGYEAANRFIDFSSSSLECLEFDLLIRQKILSLYPSFSKKLRVSFCDVTSYVVVTELLSGIDCFSFDRDFINMGLNVIQSV